MSAAELCMALAALFADVPPARSCAAAHVIVDVARATGEDPALLASIAWGESRYLHTAVNARTGVCGPMQVRSRRCRAIVRDERAGYMAGVAKLRDARAFCKRRGDTSDLCVLAGYRSGPAGVRGRWYRGPRAVLARAAAIRRVAEGRSGGAL